MKIKTIDRSLNGAGVLFTTPIVSLLPAASIASVMCAEIDDLMSRNKSTGANKIGDDRFRILLTGKTETVVGLSPHITDLGERKAVLETFGKAWDSAYDEKYLNQLMHDNSKGPHPYASLIAAFGDKGMIGDATKKVILAAADLDKRRQTERHANR